MSPLDEDLELFRQQNERYRGTPLVRRPPNPQQADQVLAKRLGRIGRHLDITGKAVMEVGSGRGVLARGMKQAGARRVVGVDINRYREWDDVDGADGVELVAADMAETPVVEDGTMDAVVSYVVFEHVRRPVETLEAIHRALKPGGTAWLYFNLHRGRKASHRYRQIFFPWPHLVFTDEVAAGFLAAAGVRAQGARTFAWVNRLTAAEYVQISQELGFGVEHLERDAKPVDRDLDFYREHEDVLGRYPALDLETDFMLMVLRKGGAHAAPALPYVERQRALSAALRR